MKRWFDNWDVITPIFKFSTEVRTAFYTTNAIESLMFLISSSEQPAKCFPQSTDITEGLIYGNVRGNQEMYYANSELGQGKGRTDHYVS